MDEQKTYTVPEDFRCCSNCRHYRRSDGTSSCALGRRTYGGAYLCRIRDSERTGGPDTLWEQHPLIIEGPDGLPAWAEGTSERTNGWELLESVEQDRCFPEERGRKEQNNKKKKKQKQQQNRQRSRTSGNRRNRPKRPKKEYLW